MVTCLPTSAIKAWTRSGPGLSVRILHGIAGNNRFFASRSESYLTGLDFFNSATSFPNVSMQFQEDGYAIGRVEDSAGDDLLIGRERKLSLLDVDNNYLVELNNLNFANAVSTHGGLDRAFADLADFDIRYEGDWV